jgi:hypothetical protein
MKLKHKLCHAATTIACAAPFIALYVSMRDDPEDIDLKLGCILFVILAPLASYWAYKDDE